MDLDIDDDYLPEFFKVYIAIHTSDHMVIPPEFVEYIGPVKSGQAKLIASRMGKTWQVELVDDGTDVCFINGWQDFVKDNLIKDGNFMFFKFHGNLIFSFVIYDESMCEKETGKCDGRGRYGVRDVKEKQNVITIKREAEDLSSPTKVKSKAVKRAVQVKPFFEKRITGYNLNFSFPMAFIKENSLCYKSKEKMILRTRRSTSWEINIINNRGIIVMSGGWIAFVRENSISVGDICKFELLDRLEMMVSVTRARTTKNGSGKKR